MSGNNVQWKSGNFNEQKLKEFPKYLNDLLNVLYNAEIDGKELRSNQFTLDNVVSDEFIKKYHVPIVAKELVHYRLDALVRDGILEKTTIDKEEFYRFKKDVIEKVETHLKNIYKDFYKNKNL